MVVSQEWGGAKRLATLHQINWRKENQATGFTSLWTAFGHRKGRPISPSIVFPSFPVLFVSLTVYIFLSLEEE